MKNAKRIMATLLALAILTTMCITASAATSVATYAYVGADATATTLDYAYDEFVGKKSNGDDIDYGSFDEQIFEEETALENSKSALGTKTIHGWKVGGHSTGVTAKTVEGRTGNALQFTNTATEAASTLLLYPALGDAATANNAYITGLVPFANYQFVFWYKGNKTFKVGYNTREAAALTDVDIPYVCTDEWQQASVNLMADSQGAVKVGFDLGEEVSSGQYVILDDVAFYRCGVANDGSVNLFGDDGLESTVTGDFDFATAKDAQMYVKDAAGNATHFSRSYDTADNGTVFTMGVSEDTAHSGKKSLKIVSAETLSADYSLYIRPQYVYYGDYNSGRVPAQNGYYTLSFWVKGDPYVYGIYAICGDNSGTSYAFSNFKNNNRRISTTEWSQVTIRNIPVTDGDIYAAININIYGMRHNATEISPLYLDDIQLVRQSNYVENGDFENGEIGVTTSVEGFSFNSALTNNTVEYTDDSISGGKALKITQNANGDVAYGGVLSADGILADAGIVEDLPAGDYIASAWSKGTSRPYFKYGPDNTYRGRLGNCDTWQLTVNPVITVSDTVTPNIQVSFLATASYIDATLYIDDMRYERVEDAVARVTALMTELNVDTADANKIEYLRQWINALEDRLDADAVRASRLSVGDVTNNGAFEADDIDNLRGYLLGSVEGTDALFDVNGDSTADICDLVRAVSVPRV